MYKHTLIRLMSLTSLGAALGAAVPAQAADKFSFMTNWYAQAEHGGFYQAIAEGTYKKYGLDVTMRMGGPQVNSAQVMAAGQVDCIMGSSDIQMIEIREAGVPVVNVAAFFQKDPTVIIAHDNVTKLEDLKGKTILIDSMAHRRFWPWLKTAYGLTDGQTKPYTFNIQPFVADMNAAQEGYITSEPYALQKAGVKTSVMLLADHGFPGYATTVSCMESTLNSRSKQVAAFIKASAEGWKSYLANPAPGNALIKKDNPQMTDDQLAYSIDKLKKFGFVTGGDAAKLGIGIITDARAKASYDFLVSHKLLDPAKVSLSQTYSTQFVKDAKVLP